MSELHPDHLSSAAILCFSTPDRVPDLLGYQSLIISASQHHHAGSWVVYDQRFHLKASTKNIKIWSAIEVTKRNIVFPDYTP